MPCVLSLVVRWMNLFILFELLTKLYPRDRYKSLMGALGTFFTRKGLYHKLSKLETRRDLYGHAPFCISSTCPNSPHSGRIDTPGFV